MFGNKKLKQKVENLEKELAKANKKIEILWDACESQIQAKFEQNLKETMELLSAILNVGKSEDSADKGTKVKKTTTKSEEKVVKNANVSADKETTTEFVNKRIERPRDSVLRKYYKQMNLNLGVRDFKKNGHLDEIETATLLYLYEQYKYIDEIAKHINLSKNSLVKYTYIIRKEGYLIFNRGMGRVANGCLIYKA